MKDLSATWIFYINLDKIVSLAITFINFAQILS